MLLMLPDEASHEDVAQLRAALGLNRPLPVRLRWPPVAGTGSLCHYVGAQVVARVTVRRHMQRQLEGRTVLLHPEARAALAAWLAELRAAKPSPPTTHVFQSRKGRNRPISRRQALRVMREVYDANELTGPLGTHAMRKTFANQVYQHLCARRRGRRSLPPDQQGARPPQPHQRRRLSLLSGGRRRGRHSGRLSRPDPAAAGPRGRARAAGNRAAAPRRRWSRIRPGLSSR